MCILAFTQITKSGFEQGRWEEVDLQKHPGFILRSLLCKTPAVFNGYGAHGHIHDLVRVYRKSVIFELRQGVHPAKRKCWCLLACWMRLQRNHSGNLTSSEGLNLIMTRLIVDSWCWSIHSLDSECPSGRVRESSSKVGLAFVKRHKLLFWGWI